MVSPFPPYIRLNQPQHHTYTHTDLHAELYPGKQMASCQANVYGYGTVEFDNISYSCTSLRKLMLLAAISSELNDSTWINVTKCEHNFNSLLLPWVFEDFHQQWLLRKKKSQADSRSHPAI